MKDSTKILIGLIVGLGVYLFMKRKALSPVASSALDAANATSFIDALPDEAVPYASVIKQVASEQGVDPFLITAIGYRESHWGALLSPSGDPGGTGDNGHGRGLMQIDDRTFGPDADGVGKGNGWLANNNWGDPYVNVTKGTQIYLDGVVYFTQRGLTGDDLVQAAIAAYNHGAPAVWANISATPPLSPDTGTTGGDYASSVWQDYQNYSDEFTSAVVTAPSSSQA